MHTLTQNVKALGWQRVTFSLVVLAYLGFLGFINVMMFVPGNWLSAMGHFDFINTGETHDLIHEFVFAFIVGTAAVGLLSQLWKPKENFAGQLVALIAWVAMIVTAAFTSNWVPQPLFLIFGGLTFIATILHPAGLGLCNWVRGKKLNRVLLTLLMIAAVPLLALALKNIGLQIAGGPADSAGLFGHNPPAFHMVTADEAAHNQKHSALGHYRNLAALSVIIILIGLLASVRPDGWPARRSLGAGGRIAAWVAGFLPVLLGITSVVLPDAESSLGLAWGLAAIVWGAVFIATAELTRNRGLRNKPTL